MTLDADLLSDSVFNSKAFLLIKKFSPKYFVYALLRNFQVSVKSDAVLLNKTQMNYSFGRILTS